MKIIAISDSHGQHENLKLPSGDMIIHAGDVSTMGKPHEIKNFLDWFESLDYSHKIFISGNHDFFFERASENEIKAMIPKGVTYLNDSGITIEGIKIWGSPIQPYFYNWAFNRQRGADIQKHWDLIPADTDILITHGPVFGILDKVTRGSNEGCEDLRKTIDIIKPKYHICGHIHEAYGLIEYGETTFINASVLDEHYKLRNAAVEFDCP